MKVIRILTLCLIVLLITMSTVHAQVSFIVASPKAGDSWKIGETKNIEWSYSSPQSVSQNWKLVLMKGSTVLGTIVDNVSGNRFSWRVGQYLGGNATPGADYKIKISHVTQTQISNNSGVFSILFSSIATKIGPKIGPSKPSMTAEQKPEFVKTKPKVELRKPNLKCSVEAYYDSYCTQKIPFTGYDYQTAPSPKFIYFLIKIKNLGGPAHDIDWRFECYEAHYSMGSPGFIPQGWYEDQSPTGARISRYGNLWSLATNEEYKFIQRSNGLPRRESDERKGVELKFFLSWELNIDYCDCTVEIKY
jgi:hypothetical protein